MSHQLIHFLLSFFILFFLFMIKSNGSSTFEYGTNVTGCSTSFICGGITIGYPFWPLDGNTNIHCGYQGFGVNCSTRLGNSNSPMFSLPAGDSNYHIRDINYHTQRLTLVDDDDLANQSCPRPRNNFTLSGTSSLSFLDIDQMLTFYFNCTSSTFDSSAIVMPCLQSGEKRTYVSTRRYNEFQIDLQWFEHCDEKVEKWAFRNETNLTRGQDTDLGVVIREAFGKGFSLDWDPNEQCIECEYSGGRCGFLDSFDPYFHPSPSFICFCPDGSYLHYNCQGNCASNDYFYLGFYSVYFVECILLVWNSTYNRKVRF